MQKTFFIINDELQDKELMTTKMKREIVLSKLMFDRSVIIDKYMATSFNDKVISCIYKALSAESRKVIMSETTNREFHKIIGFSKATFDKASPITNELILNLCNNFVNLTDCKILNL